MPSSEPETPTPRLSRGWWTGLSIGLAILAGWCLLNVLVDPTGEFGQSGRHRFNRVPPPSVIAAGVAGGNPAFFNRAIREHGGDTYLIGSSRVWRGFNTCARPDILRVAGSAWGLRELTRVEAAILDSRRTPATLLIEVGLPMREHPAIADPAQAALSTALSPRTTLQSLQTVAHSLASDETGPATYAPCSALAPGPVNWGEAERSIRYSLGLLDTSPASLAQGRRDLLAMADRADAACRRTGIRHRLVFVSLPTAPDGAPSPDHARLVRSNAARIGAMFADRSSAPGGCDIRYVDFSAAPPGSPAEQALWRDRDNWSDYTHFLPHLGALALQAVIGPPSPIRP